MSKEPKVKPKIIALVGPTASGKSEIAVRLAKKYGGEILSVDSRQIYRGMDIGTGKVEGKWQQAGGKWQVVGGKPRAGGKWQQAGGKPRAGSGKKVFVYKGVPHYGIDIASPKRQYSVAQFQKYFRRVVADILRRDKLPILCGGTAHWLDAVIYDQKFPEVKPNLALRKQLYKLSNAELFKKLQKLDPARSKDIDAQNPRRLVRALEIIAATGKAIPKIAQKSPYQVLWLGVKTNPANLQKKIKQRLAKRVKTGMFHEIKTLHKQGVSWQKMWNFGLEYRFGSLYLQGKMDKAEALKKLETAINQYSKRQMTWWKRNKEILWETDR